MKQHRFGALVLMWLTLAVPGFADTFLILVEEYRNGESVEHPLASQEGIMSAMFDLGHITFETGAYRPRISWDRLEFAEPLTLAREGGARYLAAVRVFAELRPRAAGVAAAGGPTPPEGTEIASRAEFLLFDAATSRLLGRGGVNASSSSGGKELTYGQLLYNTGESVAWELVSLQPTKASP